MIKKNLVFCITIFPEKAQNKIKQSRDQEDFLLMMKIHEANSPTQVRFHLGRDKRIFFLKSSQQQDNTLFEQTG